MRNWFTRKIYEEWNLKEFLFAQICGKFNVTWFWIYLTICFHLENFASLARKMIFDNWCLRFFHRFWNKINCTFFTSTIRSAESPLSFEILLAKKNIPHFIFFPRLLAKMNWNNFDVIKKVNNIITHFQTNNLFFLSPFLRFLFLLFLYVFFQSITFA